MLKRSLATAAAVAATLAIAAPAGAHEPTRFVVDGPITVTQPHADGIIAILIGQYTPPIGTDKGSFAGTGWGLDEWERSR